MDRPRAVLHMGVSEVDSASLGWNSYAADRAESLFQGKTLALREPYCGRIHMWQHTSAGPGV